MNSSRRRFLATGLALPAAGLATTTQQQPAAAPPAKTASAPPALSYRTLGKTGMKVTTVGFGCMITSDKSVIERAIDLGINYFDTARGYQNGNNERMVGAALGARRKNVFLATKAHTKSKAEALSFLDKSLTELGTDYVDVWFLHALGSGDEITTELMEAVEIARKSGKARFCGASTHSGQASVIDGAIKNKLDVVLVGYNYSTDPSVGPALLRAQQAGVGLVGMKVMMGGTRRPQGDAAMTARLKREGAMLSALKWVIKNPAICTTIPSMTDMDQLDENLKAMKDKFSDADEKALTAHLDRIAPVHCRTCGECAGACPQGLSVADNMRFLMYAEGYGQFQLARERFLEQTEEQRAVRCSDCSSCSVKCKYGLRIPERMIHAQELLA